MREVEYHEARMKELEQNRNPQPAGGGSNPATHFSATERTDAYENTQY